MYSIAYHTHRKVSSYVPPPSLVAWDLLSSGERLGPRMYRPRAAGVCTISAGAPIIIGLRR